MFTFQRDACKNSPENRLDKETMEEHSNFIKVRRESRHLKTLECQLSKFRLLCHNNTGGHSNIQIGEHCKNGQSNPDQSKNSTNDKVKTMPMTMNITILIPSV